MNILRTYSNHIVLRIINLVLLLRCLKSNYKPLYSSICSLKSNIHLMNFYLWFCHVYLLKLMNMIYSNHFLDSSFNFFLYWLNRKTGRKKAKCKYIFEMPSPSLIFKLRNKCLHFYLHIHPSLAYEAFSLKTNTQS